MSADAAGDTDKNIEMWKIKRVRQCALLLLAGYLLLSDSTLIAVDQGTRVRQGRRHQHD